MDAAAAAAKPTATGEAGARDAVFVVGSGEMPAGSVTVEGYDFNQGVDYHKLFQVGECMALHCTPSVLASLWPWRTVLLAHGHGH
jgi:hypothetical protein